MPTPTVATYKTTDAAYVRSLFAGFVPDPESLPGWAGIAQEGTAIVPNPVPSGRQAAPTIYAVWGLRYGRRWSDYEGTTAPARTGRLIVSRFMEANGVDDGPCRLLGTAILSKLLELPDGGDLDFDVQEADDQPPVANGDGFVILNLVVPFVGA